MFQPERMVRYGLDLVGGLQHPAFAPRVDNSVFGRRLRNECQRNFQDDCVDVLPRLAVNAAVDETILAILVFAELVPVPG